MYTQYTQTYIPTADESSTTATKDRNTEAGEEAEAEAEVCTTTFRKKENCK